MSLYENINKRRKAGISRPKSKSKIPPKAYANMKAGFPNSKKNIAKRKKRAKKAQIKKIYFIKANSKST